MTHAEEDKEADGALRAEDAMGEGQGQAPRRLNSYSSTQNSNDFSFTVIKFSQKNQSVEQGIERMYKIAARQEGGSFSKRPNAQPSMIELLQNLEKILRGVRHHIRILPKPGSKYEMEIAKADHLDPNNYDEYLFDG